VYIPLGLGKGIFNSVLHSLVENTDSELADQRSLCYNLRCILLNQEYISA
jgi:hypothetical protein